MDALQAVQDGKVYGPRMEAMMYFLRQAARELREARDRKQVHIAAGGDVDQSTVNRFERGESQPRDLDKLVEAYADDFDMDALDIWAHAIELWRSSRLSDAEAVERDQEEEDPPNDEFGDDNEQGGGRRGRKR